MRLTAPTSCISGRIGWHFRRGNKTHLCVDENQRQRETGVRKQEVGAAPRDGVHHTDTGPLTATTRQRVHALPIAARLKEPGSNPAEDLGHARVLKGS